MEPADIDNLNRMIRIAFHWNEFADWRNVEFSTKEPLFHWQDYAICYGKV